MALAVCNRMAWLPLVQSDVDVDGLEALVVAVVVHAWKCCAAGFIPVDRFVIVFTGCPDSWLGVDSDSFDGGCCP